MISFQNVSFTYAEGGNGGVLDLNLIVRSGECVLLCGPSGCGKTTVTRLANGLIPHFFHGDLSGQVNVNGMDTRETEIAALSDAVGTVFQNPRTQFFNTDTDSEIVFGLEIGAFRERLCAPDWMSLRRSCILAGSGVEISSNCPAARSRRSRFPACMLRLPMSLCLTSHHRIST